MKTEFARQQMVEQQVRAWDVLAGKFCFHRPAFLTY